MNKPAFQPAPRPRTKTSPEDAARLADAAGDLGFTRASTASPETQQGQEPKGAVAPDGDVALKIAVPKSLHRELRRAMVDRGVTVRYLILEALAAKGYAVDLAAIPEDGRRNR